MKHKFEIKVLVFCLLLIVFGWASSASAASISVCTGAVSVSGSQPTFNWGTSGDVQSAYQINIYNSSCVLIYDSGIVFGSSHSAVGPVLPVGNYFWGVRALSNVGTPGWTPFAEDSFVISPPLPPTASISQSSAQTSPGQAFMITWNSANVASCTISKSVNGGASSNIASGLSGSLNDSPVVLGTHAFTNTCSNSVGQTTYASVSHLVAAASSLPCNLPWGGTIPGGAPVTAYQASSLPCNSTCVSQLRTCTNGALTGSYTNQTCTVAACGAQTLSVAKAGLGTVTSNPAGINCGATCSALYALNTAVTLTATPSAGYLFSSWSGNCSGNGACVVTMNAPKSVAANFAPKTLNVSLSVSPSSGTSPLAVTLTANVSGTAVGTINYSLWRSCNIATTDVATVQATCGSLPSPAPGSCAYNSAGAKCNGIAAASQILDFTYLTVGTRSPKIIVERDSGVPNATDLETVTITNQAPSANNLSVVQPNYCLAGPGATFSWNFSDPDSGDTQSAYRVQVATNPGFSGPGTVINTGKVLSASNSYVPASGILSYNETYYWRVMVWDNQDAASSWVTGPSFTIPKHEYPTVDFSWSPLHPSVDEDVSFSDLTTVFGGATKSLWSWTFQDGLPASSNQQSPTVKFSSNGTKQVVLQVTDSDGYACSSLLNKTVGVRLPLPGWKEIAP